MNDLYRTNTKKVVTYTYRVKQAFLYGETSCDCNDDILIIFINGKFSTVKFPMKGLYSRIDWKVLQLIEEEVQIIERLLEDNKK